MAYSVKADLDMMFGRVNIERWADLDNLKNTIEINNRINWVIANADEYLNGRLIYRKYALPFATVPTTINFLSTLAAGIILYDGRLIKEQTGIPVDEVSRVRKEFRKRLREILNGQLTLFNPLTLEPLETLCPTAPDTANDSVYYEPIIVNGIVIGVTSRLCSCMGYWCKVCCCRSLWCYPLVGNAYNYY